jgi:Xaa-Pro dipeptidase
MPKEHAERRDRLRAALTDAGHEAALVTRLVNVRYLTGFSGSNGALLVTPTDAVLATDGRYVTQSAAQAPDVEVVVDRAVAVALVREAARRGIGRLAFESHDVTVDLHGELGSAGGSIELRSLGQEVEKLRVVKDDAEIAAVAQACAIADRAFAELLSTLRPGRTERDVAAELESRMRAHGADGPSFETIVASGPNSAVPHHRPSDRELGAGEFLKLDFGALCAGYHSDMTRTVVLGPIADWQRELYELVASAQAAGRAAVASGASGDAVDTAARSVIEEAGRGEQFVHGLGHGVGLEIHEAPSLAHGSASVLDASMIVTVEPGVYLPGQGGVRIEDTLVVPAAGAEPVVLTGSTRELIVV